MERIETRIVEITRLQNSVNGNPRYRVTFASGVVRNTATDAAVNYQITNPEYQDTPVTVMCNGRGEIIGIEVVK